MVNQVWICIYEKRRKINLESKFDTSFLINLFISKLAGNNWKKIWIDRFIKRAFCELVPRIISFEISSIVIVVTSRGLCHHHVLFRSCKTRGNLTCDKRMSAMVQLFFFPIPGTNRRSCHAFRRIIIDLLLLIHKKKENKKEKKKITIR